MSEEASGKKEILNYIKYYIESEDAKKIKESADIVNEEGFNIWSFKKLIFLEYYIKPYLSILLNRGYKCLFIDFFSSCGINKINKGEVYVLGSPIISLLKGVIPNKSKGRNNRFHKWYFIDNQENFCKALNLRVNEASKIINEKYKEKLEIGKDIKILCGDCNKKITEVVEDIKKEYKEDKIAVLAFIDPYKFSDIDWETWKRLLDLIYVDIIFTFPILTVKRGISQCKDKEKCLPPTLVKLFKNNIGIPDDKFGELYAEDIVDLVKRPVSFYRKGISVKNTINGELYRIELFTHSKAAMKITLDIAKKLDSINALDLKSIIEQINGKLRSLNDYQKT